MLTDILPAEVAAEVTSFNMFADIVPVAAAIDMIDEIKKRSDNKFAGTSDSGINVMMRKFGINIFYDSDDKVIWAIIAARENKYELKEWPIICQFSEPPTVDGFVRIVHKAKPILQDLELRGSCECARHLKMKDVDVCVSCALVKTFDAKHATYHDVDSKLTHWEEYDGISDDE